MCAMALSWRSTSSLRMWPPNGFDDFDGSMLLFAVLGLMRPILLFEGMMSVFGGYTGFSERVP